MRLAEGTTQPAPTFSSLMPDDTDDAPAEAEDVEGSY